ncbi:MAG: OsmC family peroxiredoxin, partial [Acidobacteria bacterium]|nr:OsmC family peroxiredoxin [Acidobacteriota bacterium]
MIRNSKAQWNGSLKDGSGTMALGGGAYEGPYSFSSRFESGTGTNPEELIAAAHAGCFSMALSGGLTKAGITPTRISTEARVHLDKVGEGFGITKIELVTEAEVPG